MLDRVLVNWLHMPCLMPGVPLARAKMMLEDRGAQFFACTQMLFLSTAKATHRFILIL